MEDIKFDDAAQMIICKLHGRYSADESGHFSTKLDEKIALHESASGRPGNVKIRFDLKEVDYIASAFIRTCLATSRRSDPGNFSIINASPMVKKTFIIAGLDKALNVS
jgi:anti-anti-sigma factor